MNHHEHYQIIQRIGRYLVLAGVALFSAFDYPPALIYTPGLAPFAAIPLINPLGFLYIPGLIFMASGALLSRYSAERLGIKNRFSLVRLLWLLTIVLLCNIGYNWLFLQYLP